MKQFQLITFGLLLFSNNTKAQEENPRYKFSDVYLQTNIHVKESRNFSLSEFTQIHGYTPNAMVDFQNYTSYSTHYSYLNMNFSIGASIMKLKDQRFSPKFSFKVGLEQGTQLNQYYFQTEIKRIDTLSSPNSTTEFYHDSIYTESYAFGFNSNNVRLDFSYKLVSNTKKRFSYSFGVGGSFLTSYFSYSNTNKFESMSETYTNNFEKPNSNYYYSNSIGESTYIHEEKKLKNFLSFGIITPIEVDFRISKKENFLEPFHLFYEIQPTFTASLIPNYKTATDFWCQHGLGLKYNFK